MCGHNFELIIDVNAPDARTKPLRESARHFGSVLRQQQPIGGMFGQVNKTLVQQFRMPGYPFVMITTDLLQEGEDLHTFCSADPSLRHCLDALIDGAAHRPHRPRAFTV